ncbi:unnamed protein product [Microthlaspi erraticum]|uniref:Uncharacterized protein n=1 Tax=Microthlaspi erraticum TaxID=1685480 RepID=A0A6D2KP64_9BRAS|nr:unnamed protein product [Microthlaspi erraticum]
MFGDASSKAPLGIVMDFPLRIGECTIPIDLTVLDMVDEKDVPLILGTPFLTTVGASIDFHTKKVICTMSTAKSLTLSRHQALNIVEPLPLSR